MGVFLDRLSIRNKIWTMVALFVAAISLVSLIEVLSARDVLMGEKQLKTRHLVESAYTVLDHYYDLQKKGEMTEEAARAAAVATLKAMRYDGKEYFWINDLGTPFPRMVMHPTVPALDGKVLDAAKFNCATATADGDGALQPTDGKKNLFSAFVAVAARSGSGYVTYDWPKPKAGGGVTDELFPKLSFVKKFEPWGWVVGSGIYIDDVDAAARSHGMRSLAVLAAVSAVLVVLAALFARSITRPLAATTEALRNIGEGNGDLTQRLPVEGRNEIAQLAAAFNTFSGKLQSAFMQVIRATHGLNGNSSRLSSVAVQTAAGVERQLQETRVVASAVDGMLGAVREAALNAEGAANAAREADREAVAGQRVVEETIGAIHSVAEEVARAVEVVSTLETDSRNIGAILEAIKGIADQTNLLALNAAIEAARAGEQGRGFAVVADEVRKLAQSTQEATARIQEMISRLQDQAKDAVRVMEEGRARVEASVTQAGQAGDSLGKITRSVATINDMNAQIAASVSSQSAAADSIGDSISAINRMAGETSQGVHDTEGAVADLAKLLADLEAMLSQFKVGNAGDHLNLSAAKSAHLNWKTRLRSFLDGKAVLTEAEAVSHQQCAFGKWYYGEGQRRYSHIGELREVEAPHAELHRLIKEIIQAKNEGDTANAERLFGQVNNLSGRIVALLEAAEKKA